MTPIDVRNVVKAEMRRQGITQTQMGERTGIMQESISRYLLHDAANISTQALRLLDALGLELTVKRKAP